MRKMWIKAKTKRQRPAPSRLSSTIVLVGFAAMILWFAISLGFMRPPERDPRLNGVWHSSSTGVHVAFGDATGMVHIFKPPDEHIFVQWTTRDGVLSLRDTFDKFDFDRALIKYWMSPDGKRLTLEKDVFGVGRMLER